MRIVLGTHHFPPRYVAGVELVVARLARRLADRGHQVEVVCVEDIAAPVPLSVATDFHDGIRVHRLGLQLTGQPTGLGVRFRDDLLDDWFADYFRRFRPDVFHSHSSYLLTASPLVAARRAAVKTVVTLHDYWFFCPRTTLLRSDGQLCTIQATAADCSRCLMGEKRRYRALTELSRHLPGRPDWPVDRDLLALMACRQQYLTSVVRKVDAFVSLASRTSDRLAGLGVPHEQIRHIPSGLHAVPSVRPRIPHAGHNMRIGYLGQIAPLKGVHVLIEAFATLAEAWPELELTIHGQLDRMPDYVRRLRRLAYDHPRIGFAGAYDNIRIGDILDDLDVVVVPSVCYETGPLVMLEAFAAGVPVIASRHVNLAYMIHDEQGGLLCTPGDSADLARQLRRLCDEPGLLSRLARGIPAVPSVDDEVDAIEALYQSLMTPDSNMAAATDGAGAATFLQPVVTGG